MMDKKEIKVSHALVLAVTLILGMAVFVFQFFASKADAQDIARREVECQLRPIARSIERIDQNISSINNHLLEKGK